MTLGAGSRCQESTVITFEWDLMGLKEIFESSKDDEKSPLITSEAFGGGKWQLHFYASAARAASCSLYIAAVPTQEELRIGAQTCLSQGGWPREGPHWNRKGPFSFTFEIKSLDGTIPIVARGPHEPMTRREFSSGCSTWGYPQYVRRTEIFGERAIAKANNGVKIICTMTHPLATLPFTSQAAATPMSRPVSPEILDTMIDLFDNPAHSDVVFRFPRRRRSDYRYIYASKRLLARRSGYFRSLFEGGFAEDSQALRCPAFRRFQDPAGKRTSFPTGPTRVVKPKVTDDLDDITEGDSDAESDYDGTDDETEAIRGSMEVELPRAASPQPTVPCHAASGPYQQCADGDDGERAMTPESLQSDSEDYASDLGKEALSSDCDRSPAPRIQTITVRDSAYLTYQALLFALYTDDITFAPLSSTYHTDRTSAFKSDFDFPYPNRRAYVRSRIATPKSEAQGKAPFPSSPKSLYKLADRLDLSHIKARAFQAIKTSLNPRNVATELFGAFSSLFPEVRKVELEYLLNHWEEVSHSDALMYDMNPFHTPSPLTPGMSLHSTRPARHIRSQHRSSPTNQEVFVQLLQSLRPKSRRAGTLRMTGTDREDEDMPMENVRNVFEVVI